MIVSVVSRYVLERPFHPLDFPPLLVSSLGTTVASHVFGTQDGDRDTPTTIYRFLYSSDLCSCRACSTNPWYNTTTPV